MRGRDRLSTEATWPRAIAGLLLCCALSMPVLAHGVGQPEPPAPPATTQAPPSDPLEPPAAPGSTVPGDPPTEPGPAQPQEPEQPVNPEDPTEPGSSWLDDRRLVVEQSLGGLIEAFDLFFDKSRRLDLEDPSSRFRFKTFVRTAADRDFAMGFAVGTSLTLPRLERWLGHARLVVSGEKASTGLAPPPDGGTSPTVETLPTPTSESDAAAAELTRGRGRAELRFDVVRQGVLVFDTGAGVTFAWPPVPFANIRAHLRLGLEAGFLLRATDVLFVELGGLGPGTSFDLEVERFFGPTLRLRWEGHGLSAERTRGIEWSTLVGAEWKAHRRTGLFSGVGCNGFGTPEPGLDVWRTWIGVRQDVWSGWIFAGLEPEVAWTRPPGTARRPIWAVTARLEVVLESKVVGQ